MSNCRRYFKLWEFLIVPINNDSINLYETLMLKVLKSTLMFICMQKINFISKYLLRYCGLITFEMLDHLSQNDRLIYRKTFMLLCIQKINFITHFFRKILQRNSKLVISGNLGMATHTHTPKTIVSIWRTL